MFDNACMHLWKWPQGHIYAPVNIGSCKGLSPVRHPKAITRTSSDSVEPLGSNVSEMRFKI